MKKIICGIAVTAVIATCALAGCGESEEERFNKAKENFENFTVTISFMSQGSDPFQHKWEIDGTTCQYTRLYYNATIVNIFKEENGTIYFYEGKNSWSEVSNGSIGDLLMNDESGYIGFFQEFFYDDFEKDGDYLKMTNSALEGYSKMLGATLSSAKL